MTRFKELRRIEAAIEQRNEPELRWAEAYCKMRLQIATRREHLKTWRAIEKKVQSAIREMTGYII